MYKQIIFFERNEYISLLLLWFYAMHPRSACNFLSL